MIIKIIVIILKLIYLPYMVYYTYGDLDLDEYFILVITNKKRNHSYKTMVLIDLYFIIYSSSLIAASSCTSRIDSLLEEMFLSLNFVTCLANLSASKSMLAYIDSAASSE